MASICIDGKNYEFKEGEYILNIARENGIFIPALCYLSGCSPTLACRLCMVEADGKIVYSCNAKAKDGMSVITNSPELLKERREIMKTYCVNHPLECGVCDKSGECELQNFVHYMGVNSQEFSIKDTHKPQKKWGVLQYDPALCIVCERCITVCKDKIGESALKLVPRGGDALDKSLKDTMPKDAYAVWNKFQKNLIGVSEGDVLDCSKCGECISVCPTGAIIDANFQYTSNAWELEQIDSSNPHSSDCELIYYDIKPTSIENRKKKIYRVSNDFTFAAINSAARFAFNTHKESSVKNRVLFERVANKIKNGEIKTIKFNSFITNEDAKILSLLKEKYNLKLINKEAKKYQNFIREFSKFSGSSLYTASSYDVQNSDFIVVCGSFLRSDSPNLSYKVNNAIKINKAGGIYFHHISDRVVNSYGKNFLTHTHKFEIDIEILLFILKNFGQNLPEWLVLSSALELENFEAGEKNAPVLIIGEDFIYSKNSGTLAKLAGMIAKFTNFKVLIIPPRTNSLGVSLICELDDETDEGEILGYNEEGDISFSSLKGDLDAPSLNEQNGTFVNFDKRVVPLKAALKYSGFTLNDLANKLSVRLNLLGGNFKNLSFDELDNYYDNAGNNKRGYELENSPAEEQIEEFEIKNLNEASGENSIYLANPIHQFSKFTNLIYKEEPTLYASSEFIAAHGLGDRLRLSSGEEVLVKLDKNILNSAYLADFKELNSKRGSL